MVLDYFRVCRDAMQEAEVVCHATLERRVRLVSIFGDIGEHRQRNPHAGRIVPALMVGPAVGIELCLEQLGRLIRGESEDRPAQLSVAGKGRCTDRSPPVGDRALHGARPDGDVFALEQWRSKGKLVVLYE
jgi:hypothetical protein